MEFILQRPEDITRDSVIRTWTCAPNRVRHTRTNTLRKADQPSSIGTYMELPLHLVMLSIPLF